jgi:hypothetical protein
MLASAGKVHRIVVTPRFVAQRFDKMVCRA